MNQRMIEKTMHITTLQRDRTVRIFLPYDYDVSDDRYPVMYMHDGQNLFVDEMSYAKHSWGVPRKFNGKDQRQFIVVGVDNGGIHRLDEYSPFEPNKYARDAVYKGTQIDTFNSEGTLYMTWLAEALKPYIDNHYRTKSDFKNTLLVGSSMGGLISMYGGLQYKEVFGGLGILSPAFWYCKEKIFAYVKNADPYQGKVFMSVGTSEDGLAEMHHYLADAKEMQNILNAKNIYNQTVVIEMGRHHESFWETLLVEMTDFLMD